MIPLIAALGCAGFIALLFRLNYDRTIRTSIALWLPVIWLFLGGTRNVSDWLQLGGPEDAVDRYMEGNAVDRNVLTVLLIAGIIVLIRRGPRLRILLRDNAWVLAYFVYCGTSVVWSDYPFVGFKRWIRSLGDLVMVLVILSEVNRVGAIKRVFSRVGFIVLPLSILFIRYFSELGRAYGIDGSIYWTGVAQGKNGLGMLCLMFGLPALWQFYAAYTDKSAKKQKAKLFAHGVIALMAVYLLSIVDSKTSLACFVLGAGLMTITTFTEFFRRPAVLRPVVISLISVSFAVLFLGIGGGALKAIGRDPTLTGRTNVWQLVLKFTANPIVGAGYESFWMGKRLEEIVAVNGGINQAHNGYIEVYLNLGLVGVVLLGALLVTGYRRVFAAFREDPQACTLRLAFFAVVVVFNFTEGAFKMMYPVWFTFLLVIMAFPRVRSSAVAPSVPNRTETEPTMPEVEPRAEQLLSLK
jgi:exopolysaccharide production protein ExoQ